MARIYRHELTNKTPIERARGRSLNCDHCGQSFWRKAGEVNRSDKHFCSQGCYWESRRVFMTCIICGKTAKLAQSRAAESSTCGSESCKSARRSIDNISRAARLPLTGETIDQYTRATGLSPCAARLRLKQFEAELKPITTADRRKRGADTPRAKLTENKVLQIKRRLGNGETPAAIARDFAVSWTSIDFIKKGKSWGWLK